MRCTPTSLIRSLPPRMSFMADVERGPLIVVADPGAMCDPVSGFCAVPDPAAHAAEAGVVVTSAE